MITNRYECLMILDTGGKDDALQGIVERLQKDYESEGAKVEQVQRMDRRNFSYVAGKLSSGYYVNFVFEAQPDAIDKLKAKFRLDKEVYRQHYQKLEGRKEVGTAS